MRLTSKVVFVDLFACKELCQAHCYGVSQANVYIWIRKLLSWKVYWLICFILLLSSQRRRHNKCHCYMLLKLARYLFCSDGEKKTCLLPGSEIQLLQHPSGVMSSSEAGNGSLTIDAVLLSIFFGLTIVFSTYFQCFNVCALSAPFQIGFTGCNENFHVLSPELI